MKVGVSLPNEDVAYLDTYAREQRLGSRSAALQKAVRLLRASELGADYESAWAEWDESGEATEWEPTAGDGLSDR
jgi:Arc/MetJ-type ribon-helix-helix transcriptional regulator